MLRLTGFPHLLDHFLSIILLRSIVFCILSFAASTAFATANIHDQRYAYELAKTALKNQDEAAFKQHYQVLENYPLRIYLDYQRIRAGLKLDAGDAATEAERFLQQHANSYLGDKLHREYLNHLATQKQWAGLMRWYTPKHAGTVTRCRWTEARVRSGDTQVLSEVAEIWLKPKSLPDECDSLFSLWKDSKFYTEHVVWQRFMLAMNASNIRLARYLAKFTSESYQDYIDLAFQLKRAPEAIGDYARFARHTPEMQSVIVYGIRHLARQNPNDALKHWRRYEAQHMFDMHHISSAKTRIASRLISNGDTVLVEDMLKRSPSLRRPATIERLIRTQLKEQRWESIISTIALLPESKRNSERWRYWQLRAVEELGASVTNKYQELAHSRSYYGFLAADKLGQPYRINAEPLHYSQDDYARVKNIPDFIRAKELWLSGYFSEAYSEWYYGLRPLSQDEILAAGALARDWAWHDRAINAMIAGKQWELIDLRFPLAFQEAFEQAAKDTRLHPELLFAVARQESAMSEGAVSPAGARGLMQLLPSTAKYTAKKLGIPHATDDLFDPNHNITLGSRYLNELYQQFNGNRILATAAYNAGPHRVEQWVAKSSSQLPFDVWIETIPFKETRGYVQNVLTYSVIYSFVMGNPTSFITQNEAKTKL